MNRTGELQQQIEDLALQLIVGEPENAMDPSVWMPVLERISASAAREQAGEVITAAAALTGALRASAESRPADPVALSSLLHEGITKLQQALKTPSQGSSSRDVLIAQDPELMSDFVVESREHLANIETQVLTLERDPSDPEALSAVFRGFHTIKGLAGFMELWEVQKLAHEVETVLDRARESQWTITVPAIDVILQSADYLRRWLLHVESALQNRPSEAPLRDEALLSRIGLLSTGPEESPVSSTAPQAAPQATHYRNETMVVKVDTAKLDYLVDMAGEMVIAESIMRHDGDLAAVESPLLQRKIAHLTRITLELQKTAMAMRLVPIGPLFRRMARLVRDLSKQFGKQVQMETQGDEIELDRRIVEELADPLMHMVRNALDHGIENPQERATGGKPDAARLLLKAHHQAGQVVIEVTDDGRGLDRGKIKSKAIQKGLIASGAALSDTEICHLIFEPGFTTAAHLTNVSGRGVGMDVVRRHIEKLRGRIEIRSVPGSGATFLLKLPLTLAIIEGLVVGVGGERYIMPLLAVREMFRPAPETIWTVNQRAEMALVRGALLPVLRLYRMFNVTPRSEDPLASVLVVAEVEGQRFCVLVDELIGKQEVVIKPLGETFKGAHGIAGGAILGDGRVGLILDLERLFKERTNAATC